MKSPLRRRWRPIDDALTGGSLKFQSNFNNTIIFGIAILVAAMAVAVSGVVGLSHTTGP